MRTYLKLLLSCSAFLSSQALAQDTVDPADGAEYIIITHEPRETYITVLGNGLRQRLGETAQPVSLFDRGEITRAQSPDLAALLERAPGVTVSRNGGPGAFAAVRVRGAEAEQLVVLLDGVRIADPASPAGGFDFGTLGTAAIGKMELLRGSNSTIWGADAIGGVLAAWTHGLEGVDASVEFGARDTLFASANAGAVVGPLEVALNGAWFDTDGFSAAASGSEADGYRQWQAGGYANVRLSDEIDWRSAVRMAEGRLEFDGFPAPAFTFADTDEYSETRQFSALTGLDYDSAGFDLRLAASIADTERDSFDPAFGTAPTYSTDGESRRVEARARWEASQTLSLDFGGEAEWRRFETSFDARQDAAIAGGYVQAGYSDGVLTAHLGARVDDHDTFGTATSFGADAAYELGDGWRVRASFGEGFKPPSLFQLYSDFGNLALRPERSTGVDLGVELNDRNSGGYASLTLFRRDSEDLVSFVSCFGVTTGICAGRPFGTYDNIGRTRAQGVEVEGGYSPADDLQLRLAYSFIDTENRTRADPNAGNVLARRPRHALTAMVEWDDGDRLRLGAEARVVSASYDDAGNAVRLDGYGVLTLRASYDTSDDVTLFGRVENALNEDYETAAGYGNAGRGVFVGAKARF